MICEKEYKVVITACAPFKENEKNLTQDVKVALPDRIERGGRIPIRIIKFHTHFRNVITDMDMIQQLWNEDKRVYDPDSKEGKKIHVAETLMLGIKAMG
ncbi:hypothetical protein ACJ41O_006882 [Fusarium nematophilum]